MDEGLIQPFTRLDVEAALKHMAPLKALRPDGFGACFYQNHWHLIGNEVSQAVLSILNGNFLSEIENFTYIALIPKVKCSRYASDFKPTSLCNIFYKLITKCLVNR